MPGEDLNPSGCTTRIFAFKFSQQQVRPRPPRKLAGARALPSREPSPDIIFQRSGNDVQFGLERKFRFKPNVIATD
jgi:hypothetical protein